VKGGWNVAPLLIPIIASVVAIIIFSIVFKGKTKVDKGFKLNYYRLSYRRKMIRTLMISPIIILAIIVIFFYADFSMSVKILFGFTFFMLFVVQLVYNFYMWKKKESE
jgi:hypothetical protein